MRQLSVTFKPDVQEKLRQYADKHGIGIAEGIRRLVDIGLRMEEYQEKNKDSAPVTTDIEASLLRLEKIAERNMNLNLQANMFAHVGFEHIHGASETDKKITAIRADANKRTKNFMDEI